MKNKSKNKEIKAVVLAFSAVFGLFVIFIFHILISMLMESFSLSAFGGGRGDFYSVLAYVLTGILSLFYIFLFTLLLIVYSKNEKLKKH